MAGGPMPGPREAAGAVRFGTALLIVIGCAIGLAPERGWAQVPPSARWVTVESPNFRVTFSPGLESLARHTAHRAELARAWLAEELARPPRGKIDIVLTDFADLSNGFATPFPSNRITLYARPPVDHLALSNFSEWIDLVLTHELAHIFHLDAAGGLGRALRGVFGRVPVGWPLFPVVGTPTWSVEGLATYIESSYTGAGRVHGSFHEMVLRTAVLEDAFASIDEVSGTGASWPGGMRPYIYGSLFLDHLSRRYGPEVQQGVLEATAGAWLPPPLFFGRVARKATGRSFTELYAEWREELEGRYGALADSLAAAGITRTKSVGKGGYNTLHPRVGPDGRVAYASADGRNAAANRILDPTTGEVRTLSRRNDIGPVSWFPDGALLTAQLEFDGPDRIYSDLYRVDERGERRLTRRARLTEPDLAPDGRRVVAVQGGGGTNRLAVVDLESGVITHLADADPEVHWAFPRWAPGGDRIAATRWEGGAYEVVVIDTTGAILHRLETGDGGASAPAWSADGGYLLFSSARTGIPNLYAYDLAGARLHQVTNLLTGAFFPDASPDGHWIYFSAYHADGFHIERIPYDPASWRAPAPVRERPRRVAGGDDVAPDLGPARPYSPLRSLLPRYWLPHLEGDRVTGTFYGVGTSGEDLVGRHTYSVAAGYQPGRGLLAGRISYLYGGIGNPWLGVSAASSREGALLSGVDPDQAALIRRDDEVSLTASFIRQRYRSAAQLTVGAEGIRHEWSLHEGGVSERVAPASRLAGAVLHASYANYRAQPFSIGREDGVALSVTGRRRWDLEPRTGADGTERDAGYDEVSGEIRAYKALDLPGYSRHVVALRLGGRWRQGPGAAAFGVGGSSGSPLDLGITTIGGGRRFLPVRGFDPGARGGTRAWSGSLEYRFPIALVERGVGLAPLFLDRVSGSLFLDAGGAYCGEAERARPIGCSAEDASPLVSTGAELGLDVSLFFARPTRFRGGVAVPVQGGSVRPQLYFELGVPF